MQNPGMHRDFAFLVAGVGIEPTYRGYEPRDQPLVHPAML